MVDPPSHREESSNSVNQEFLDSLKSMMLEMKADLEKIKTEQSKKSTHQSESEKYYSSSRSRSSRRRVHQEDLEQRLPQTQTRDPLAGLKIKIPSFLGTNDPEEYLEWEKKIEIIFECRGYSQEIKVHVAQTAFQDYAFSWWDQLVTSRKRAGDVPIDSWNQMKLIMRKRFIPSHYQKERNDREEESHTQRKSSYPLNLPRAICFQCRNNMHYEKDCPKRKVTKHVSPELKNDSISERNVYVSSNPRSSAKHLLPSKGMSTGSDSGKERLDENLNRPRNFVEQKEIDLIGEKRPTFEKKNQLIQPPTESTLGPQPIPSVKPSVKPSTKLMIESNSGNQLSLSSIPSEVVPVKSASSEPGHPSNLVSVPSSFEPELIDLEPVKPSNLVPIPQDNQDKPQKESSEETQRSSTLVTHPEPPIQLVPEPPPVLFPYNYPKNSTGSKEPAGTTELHVLIETLFRSLTLPLPNLIKTFEISFNASGHCQGFVLMQGNKPIIFFGEKNLLQPKQFTLHIEPEFVQPPKGPDKPLVKHPGILDPGTLTDTDLQGKEIIVIDTIIPRYATLSVPNADLLKHDNVRMFNHFSNHSRNEFSCSETFWRRKLIRYKGFIFDRDKVEFLSQKPLFSRLTYSYDTYNRPSRVFSENTQDVPNEVLNCHSLKMWLFHVWLKKNDVQAKQELLKFARAGSQATPCRRMFDPGIESSVPTKSQNCSSTIQLELRGMHYLCVIFNINLVFLCFAGRTDLRSNPSQLGEDDVSMATKEPQLKEQLEPEDAEDQNITEDHQEITEDPI